MQLVERMWAVVTAVVSLVTFTPLPDSGIDGQVSLQFPLPVAPVAKPPGGPVFTPPGTDLDVEDTFKCDYSNMPGWEPCSTPEDRKCWLRRLSDGKRYDIFTNYEVDAPIGITRYYEMNLTSSSWDKDGLPFKAAKFFNNTYPGPWIQACWGDTVVVNVTNKLTYNGTSVHWHGIRQLNTTHMDGVNGVTQCPIAPHDHFAYKWKAWQYGSSWYHSHYSVQYADGAVGPLTLHGPTSTDFDEAINPPLIMTDWGHESAFVAETNEGKLDQKDILLNGYGNVTRFNKIANKTNIEPPYSITFEGYQPGTKIKKYLLRVINTSFDTTFVFSIDNHWLTVASADFVPISPYKNTSILVGIGQRYNVVVEANPEVTNQTGPLDPKGNYWIRTWISPCFQMKAGIKGYERTGILRYNKDSKDEPKSEEWKNVAKNCSDETYGDLHPMLPWTVKPLAVNGDAKYGELFNVASDFSGANNSYPLARFSLDLTGKYVPMRVDYENPAFLHLDHNGPWAPQWRIVEENYTKNDWVYIVIKSTGPHPIHLHGHDFALLEQAYNKTFDVKTMNLTYNNPPRRDVVLLPGGWQKDAKTPSTSGYVVIAFKADNPGPWLVHCHIATHISWGLGMSIMEAQGIANDIWPKPNDSAIVEAERVCTNWTNWVKDPKHWAPSGCTDKDAEMCFQDDSGV